MRGIFTVIRQWCAECGRATVSKTCCAGHWPETWCTGCRTQCPVCVPLVPDWGDY
jgi:hypothetical protein